MALNITLKPHEKLFIGGAVIENGTSKAEFSLLNDAPILREKEILREQDARTPATRIYLAIQMMYMDVENSEEYQQLLNQLMQDVAQAAPSTIPFLEEINTQVGKQNLYKALKETKRLINYEKELLKHVQVTD